MVTLLTKQTNQRPRAVLKSPLPMAQGRDTGMATISRNVENPPDIGFRITDTWRGRGAIRGDLTWACGNCRHPLLADFAALPFVNPPLIECGHCGAYSKAHGEDESERV